MKEYRYRTTIVRNGEMDAGYVVFPYDLRAETGKGRLHVKAAFDGVPYEGSIVNMGLRNADGSICYIIGVTKEIRRKTGKSFGDEVDVVVTAEV